MPGALPSQSLAPHWDCAGNRPGFQCESWENAQIMCGVQWMRANVAAASRGSARSYCATGPRFPSFDMGSRGVREPSAEEVSQ